MPLMHCVLYYAIFSFVLSVHAESISDVENLLNHLFSEQNYNTNIRGKIDQTHPTQVNVSLNLLSIQELDDVSQTMTSLAAVNCVWKDERLVWNDTDFNGTSEFIVPQTRLWRPELLLSNPAEHVRFLGDDRRLLRVTKDGRVHWTSAEVFTSMCSIDVTYYPFDRQSCAISFVVTGRTSREITIGSSSQISLGAYFGNGEWELIDSSVRIAGSRIVRIHFMVTLKRRASFIIVLQVIPVMMLGIMNTLVFFVPPQSGERLSYSITVLLSLAVFFTIVGDAMPRNAETMANMCYFLLFTIGLSVVTCILIIVSLGLYFADEEGGAVYPWLERLLSRCQCRWLRARKDTENGEDTNDDQNAKTRVVVNSNTKVTWRDVSKVFDKTCFVVLFVAFLVGTVHFMYTVSKSS